MNSRSSAADQAAFHRCSPSLLRGVTDPADLTWMASRLTGHPWKYFEQRLALPDEAGYANIPQYHIICASTLATRDPGLMEEARTADRLWVIDTGHDLMITEPKKVADALADVAAELGLGD